MTNLVVVTAYFVALVGFGLWKARAVKGQEAFALADRGLPLFILLGTLLATWTGTGSIFANAGRAYHDGFGAFVLCLGPTAGFLVLMVLAGKVRARGRYTLQDLLEERFGPAARVLGMLTLVSAYLVIVSYQLRAAAVVLEMLVQGAGLGAVGAHHTSVMVGVCVIIGVYTALGGMLSVAFTDTFNGVLMTLGMLAALPVTWWLAGGWSGVTGRLPAPDATTAAHLSLPGVLSVTLPTFLLVLGDANLHARFLAARSGRTARTAVALLIPATLFIDGSIILVAIAGSVLLPGLADPSHVVPALASGTLPQPLAGLLMASVVAIIISTADSYLLTSANTLLRDVWQRFVRPGADDRQLLATARWLVLGCSALALWMAFASAGFFEVAFLAYTIYGVGITPPLLAALFWKRATPAGAVASMLVGGVTTTLWWAFDGATRSAAALHLPEGTQIDAVIPALLLAALTLVLVSLVTRPRPAVVPGAATA
ncbi:MAG TPA: sodium:solute symporter family protein [Planctomycetota bacterium]|nr:sodium:solute symporter family protein [Planctomycetota bacterium]